MLKTFKQFRYPLITPRLYKDDIQKGISAKNMCERQFLMYINKK